MRKILLLFSAILLGCFSLAAQNQSVSGTVTVTDGSPAVGVTVLGSNAVSITDSNGQYSISVPASASLEFSFIGMVTQTVPVEGRSVIDIVMQTDATSIEDVVVVGFGRQRRESVVGAVATINPSQLKIPTSNLSNAFAGKLAGVIAVQRTGEPGADGSSFWIRGISTFAGSTSPLIFIDGVESSTYDMNSLAPEVIEGFSILKDATATALYGARGANGVMLITTRQGADMERARINIRVEGAMSSPVKTLGLADGVDYMIGFNEALTTRGAARNAYFSDQKIEQTRLGSNPLVFPNVDWQKFLFKDWSFNQSANLNVTGGGEKVTYFMSASLNNDNGLIKNDPNNSYKNNISQQRYSIQGNIAAKLTSTTTATVRLNTNILQYGGSHQNTATIYANMFMSPGVLFPAYYPSEPGDTFVRFGNVQNGPHATGGTGGVSAYHNVYADMVRGYSKRSENTNTVSFEIDQKLDFLTEGLSVNAMYSFKNWTTTTVTRTFNPSYFEREGDYDDYTQNSAGEWTYGLRRMNPGDLALSTSTSSGGDRLMNVQAKVDWLRSFGNHNVSAMAIYLMRDYNTNTPGDYYAALPTRNQGFAGRLTYDFDMRYLLELNFGYNGSENFADGKRFGFFPSVGVGYNISRETFWEPLSNVVPNLKIYGSYGLVGNASTDSRFPYLTKVNLGGRGYSFGYNRGNNIGNGAVVTTYGADNATWERGYKANIGIDMNLFRALNITFDVYRENRTGIFMQYNTVPVETGILGGMKPYANLGKVKNEGIDLAVNYDKAFRSGLILNIRGTLTYSKNTLMERDEPDGIPTYRSEIGRSLNINKGLVALGLFADEQDVANSPRQYGDYGVGDIKYKDINEDGIVDDNDMTYIGNPWVPQLVYGFGASAQYKGFDASFFFQGSGKTSLLMGDIHPFGNQYTQMYQFIADDYWTEANPDPNAKYPRLVSGTAPGEHNNHKASTWWLHDNSFIRLKNAEIGYTHKFVRFYLSGQNLLTISKFKYWDPESGGQEGTNNQSQAARGLRYPTMRTIMLGAQLTF